jgi:hypothetical protein
VVHRGVAARTTTSSQRDGLHFPVSTCAARYQFSVFLHSTTRGRDTCSKRAVVSTGHCDGRCHVAHGAWGHGPWVAHDRPDTRGSFFYANAVSAPGAHMRLRDSGSEASGVARTGVERSLAAHWQGERGLCAEPQSGPGPPADDEVPWSSRCCKSPFHRQMPTTCHHQFNCLLLGLLFTQPVKSTTPANHDMAALVAKAVSTMRPTVPDGFITKAGTERPRIRVTDGTEFGATNLRAESHRCARMPTNTLYNFTARAVCHRPSCLPSQLISSTQNGASEFPLRHAADTVWAPDRNGVHVCTTACNSIHLESLHHSTRFPRPRRYLLWELHLRDAAHANGTADRDQC